MHHALLPSITSLPTTSNNFDLLGIVHCQSCSEQWQHSRGAGLHCTFSCAAHKSCPPILTDCPTNRIGCGRSQVVYKQQASEAMCTSRLKLAV